MKLSWLLFSFEGRIGRQPYWAFFLASIVIMMLSTLVISGIFPPKSTQSELSVNLVLLLLLWPSLAVQAKRWHDRDKSAWWIAIQLVPVIGPLWALVENGFLPGTPGDNRFGKDPLRSRDDQYAA